jgi:hypothetical protein
MLTMLLGATRPFSSRTRLRRAEGARDTFVRHVSRARIVEVDQPPHHQRPHRDS